MSKKKKKKGKGYDYVDDGMYNEERNKAIADSLEDFVETIENLCILTGKKEDEVKKAIKTVKKACKHLRNGEPEKVFDEDRFYEFINEGGSLQ